LKTGIVAYLRCTGLPERKGPYPCPRDRKLERSVWRALRTLETCTDAGVAAGKGQVRFEFTRAGIAELEIKSRGGGLDRDVVDTCAGPALARVRTTLRAVQLIVSFRFSLQSAPRAQPNPR
jgi:hypothetical protein